MTVQSLHVESESRSQDWDLDLLAAPDALPVADLGAQLLLCYAFFRAKPLISDEQFTTPILPRTCYERAYELVRMPLLEKVAVSCLNAVTRSPIGLQRHAKLSPVRRQCPCVLGVATAHTHTPLPQESFKRTLRSPEWTTVFPGSNKCMPLCRGVSYIGSGQAPH